MYHTWRGAGTHQAKDQAPAPLNRAGVLGTHQPMILREN